MIFNYLPFVHIYVKFFHSFLFFGFLLGFSSPFLSKIKKVRKSADADKKKRPDGRIAPNPIFNHNYLASGQLLPVRDKPKSILLFSDDNPSDYNRVI